MYDILISWSARHPTIAVILLIALTAFFGLVSSFLFSLAGRFFAEKKLSLFVGTSIDLLLVGAIVAAANEAYVRRLENRTRDSAAKLSAMLSTGASLMERNANECEEARAILGLLSVISPITTNGNPAIGNPDHPFNPYNSGMTGFRWTKRPPLDGSQKFRSAATRARHGYSIVPQLIDPATSESERELLWGKMEFVIEELDSHFEKWTAFTQEYQTTKVQMSGGDTMPWFDQLASDYGKQRKAEASSLPKGLWEVLGYVALVLKLGESWWKYRSEKSSQPDSSISTAPAKLNVSK